MDEHDYCRQRRGRPRGRGGQLATGSRSSTQTITEQPPANQPTNTRARSLVIRGARAPNTPRSHSMALRRTGTAAPAPAPMQQGTSAEPILDLHAQTQNLQTQFGLTPSEIEREMNRPFHLSPGQMSFRTRSEANLSISNAQQQPPREPSANQSVLNFSTLPSVVATAVANIPANVSFNSQPSLGLRQRSQSVDTLNRGSGRASTIPDRQPDALMTGTATRNDQNYDPYSATRSQYQPNAVFHYPSSPGEPVGSPTRSSWLVNRDTRTNLPDQRLNARDYQNMRRNESEIETQINRDRNSPPYISPTGLYTTDQSVLFAIHPDTLRGECERRHLSTVGDDSRIRHRLLHHNIEMMRQYQRSVNWAQYDMNRTLQREEECLAAEREQRDCEYHDRMAAEYRARGVNQIPINPGAISPIGHFTRTPPFDLSTPPGSPLRKTPRRDAPSVTSTTVATRPAHVRSLFGNSYGRIDPPTRLEPDTLVTSTPRLNYQPNQNSPSAVADILRGIRMGTIYHTTGGAGGGPPPSPSSSNSSPNISDRADRPNNRKRPVSPDIRSVHSAANRPSRPLVRNPTIDLSPEARVTPAQRSHSVIILPTDSLANLYRARSPLRPANQPPPTGHHYQNRPHNDTYHWNNPNPSAPVQPSGRHQRTQPIPPIQPRQQS